MRQSPGQLWLIINFEMSWLKVVRNNFPPNLGIKMNEFLNNETFIEKEYTLLFSLYLYVFIFITAS